MSIPTTTQQTQEAAPVKTGRRPDATTNAAIWENTSQAGGIYVSLKMPGYETLKAFPVKQAITKTDPITGKTTRGPDFTGEYDGLAIWKNVNAKGVTYSVSLEGHESFTLFGNGEVKAMGPDGTRQPDATVNGGLWHNTPEGKKEYLSIRIPGHAEVRAFRVPASEQRVTAKSRSPDFEGLNGSLGVWRNPTPKGFEYNVDLDGHRTIKFLTPLATDVIELVETVAVVEEALGAQAA